MKIGRYVIKNNPDNPDQRKIRQAIEILRSGGIIIYPTDTIYGLGCDIFQKKAIEKICKLRGLNPAKANLSIVCKDISQLAEYTVHINNATFKLIKRNTPGPFTFILKSSKQLPKSFENRRKPWASEFPKMRS